VSSLLLDIVLKGTLQYIVPPYLVPL